MNLRGVTIVLTLAFFQALQPTTSFAAFEAFGCRFDHFLHNASMIDRTRSVSLMRVGRFGLPELAITGLRLSLPHGRMMYGAAYAATGDDIYREQKISGLCSVVLDDWIVQVACDLYRIDIKDHGSATAPGVSLAAALRINGWSGLEAGVDGLYRGSFRANAEDLVRSAWGMVHAETGVNRISLLLELPEGAEPSLGFGYSVRFLEKFGFRLMLMDNPNRIGGGIYFKISPVEATVSLDRHYPLGWTQSVGLKISW